MLKIERFLIAILVVVTILLSFMISTNNRTIEKMIVDLDNTGQLLTQTTKERDALLAMEIESVSEKVREECDKHGVDYKLAMAIAKTETGNFTSEAFYQCNNIGGMMRGGEVIKYKTLNRGVEAFIENLAENYIDKGLTTIDTIQPKYCPNGEDWIKNVRYFYEDE